MIMQMIIFDQFSKSKEGKPSFDHMVIELPFSKKKKKKSKIATFCLLDQNW